MFHHRLIPLLIAGTACLPLAACGGDEEPTASATPTTAPAETPLTAPSDAPGDSAPADTNAQPPAGSDPEGPTSSTSPGRGTESGEAGDAAATPDTGRASDTTPSTPSADGSDAPSESAPKAKDKQPAAPKVPKALEDYAKGGAPATTDEAKAVRDTMTGFQDALVAQDAAKACSYTLGLPAKADPSKPAPSCEALVEGSKMAPPTDKDRETIRTAKITVNGDRASIELDGSGVPMPFRKVDGRWRIDYGTLLGTSGSAE